MIESTINYESSRPVYYKHSGKFSIVGIAAMLTLGVVAALLGGPVYAYITIYPPYGGLVNPAITGATAFTLGYSLAFCVKWGKIRNIPLALFIAIIASMTMFLAAWGGWVYTLLHMAHARIPLIGMLLHPIIFIRIVQAIDATGAWTFHDFHPTGITLGMFWAIEAGILLIIPIAMTYSAVTQYPFCEHCQRWGSSEPLLRFKRANIMELRSKIPAKDFSYFATLEKAPDYFQNYWKVHLQGCAKCDTTQTLCVDEIDITKNPNHSRDRIKKRPLVHRLRLTPEETASLVIIIAGVSSRPGDDVEDEQSRVSAEITPVENRLNPSEVDPEISGETPNFPTT